jgi:hypothetical protein
MLPPNRLLYKKRFTHPEFGPAISQLYWVYQLRFYPYYEISPFVVEQLRKGVVTL